MRGSKGKKRIGSSRSSSYLSQEGEVPRYHHELTPPLGIVKGVFYAVSEIDLQSCVERCKEYCGEREDHKYDRFLKQYEFHLSSIDR